MHYILFYSTVENFTEKRKPYREEHLSMVTKAYENGTIVMAGALAEPADGAVIVFKGESVEIAENFAKNDPYVKNGLITTWTVRQWNVVVAGD